MNELLQEQGYIHVPQAGALSWVFENQGFSHFQQSWNDLPADNHLNDSGNYRYRRYAVFNSIAGTLKKLPLEAHYQTREYNPLHGGYFRYFSEIQAVQIESPILKKLIEWNLQLISTEEQTSWRIQCHQFRIRASDKEAGKPSPEGIHQDGSEYVFIMLLDRHNVTGASNTIHDSSGKTLYEITMTHPGEAILVNDTRHWHGVSEIQPKDTTEKDAYRDVFVMTFHKI